MSARHSRSSNTKSSRHFSSKTSVLGQTASSNVRGRRRGRASNRDEPAARSQHVMPFQGDLPPLNVWSRYIIDHQQSKFYIYGGTRPGDDTNSPTSDLFMCDMSILSWTNLTEKVHSSFPSSETAEANRLPARAFSAATYFRTHGNKQYAIIFGGFSTLDDSISSSFVFLDLDELSWTVITPAMPAFPEDAPPRTPVRGRISAALVAVGTRLFVFGGLSEFGGEPLRSFCVAEVVNGSWAWVVCDQPYPDHVPDLGKEAVAISVYGGAKILLTMSRQMPDDRISLSAATSVLFHPHHYTFQCQTDTRGDFPQEVGWYQLCSLPAHQTPTGTSPTPSIPPTAKPRGRQRRAQAHSTSPHAHQFKLSAPSTSSMNPNPERTLICAWVLHGPPADQYFVPEFWVYTLPPDEEVRCLNVRQQMWDWDSSLDLQCFVVVGSRAFLLGCESPEDASDADAVYNVCVEVVLS